MHTAIKILIENKFLFLAITLIYLLLMIILKSWRFRADHIEFLIEDNDDKDRQIKYLSEVSEKLLKKNNELVAENLELKSK